MADQRVKGMCISRYRQLTRTIANSAAHLLLLHTAIPRALQATLCLDLLQLLLPLRHNTFY
jgi:hypothetical protein